MALHSEATSQSLEKKLIIAGFEVPDILAIFTLLSVLNFVFGKTHYKLFLIWIPVVLTATILRLGKRGKPDNYLVHLIRFHLGSKYFSSFQDPIQTNTPPKIKRGF